MSSPADAIIELYRQHAKAWDDGRGRTFFERVWLDRFLAYVPHVCPVLDIGCGAAEPIARYLVLRGHPVTGVDASAPLIEISRAREPDQDWIVADMRQLDLQRQFGGLIAWDSFFHLTVEDQRCMFPIFAKHAQRGAPLLFTTAPTAGESVGTFEGQPLYHASLDASGYQHLLEQSEFKVLHHVANDQNCGGHTVWLAQRI